MKLTVRTKALIFMISTLVIVSLVYTYESISTEKSIVREQIVKRAETITTLATKTGELPILSGNPTLLKETLSFLKSTSEVSSVTFYDSKMTILIHDGPPIPRSMPVPPSSSAISFFDESDSFIFFAPVFTERNQEDFEILRGEDIKKTKEQIGWIRLGFSKSYMNENEQRIVVRGLLLAAIFTMAGSLLVYFLLGIATRPLTRIVQAAHEIADGDLSQELSITSNDEIGALANAFNSMKDTMQKLLGETDGLIGAVKEGKLDARGDAGAFKGSWRRLVEGVNGLTDAIAKGTVELQHANNSLERRVAERTAELALINEELLGEIRERRRAEEGLRHAKNFTENLIQGANAIVVGLDTAGCVALLNRTAEEVIGYSLAEFEGKNWFDMMIPATVFPADHEIFRRLTCESMPDTCENTMLNKKGEKRIITWRNNPIMENGVIVGTLSFGIDITEHRRVEAQLRQSQKMEAIGRLAGGVAHDFNNMLSVILGFAELSMLSVPEAGKLRHYLDEITKAALRSRDITRQLLAFSRKEVIIPKPLNLNVLISETEKSLRRLIGEDINLAFKPATGLWSVLADSSQVDQILMNLAVNARDAMPDGGDLSIETANAHIEQEYCNYNCEAHAGDYVQIAVSDNGTGMDKETLKHIFEPFFTTKEVGKGTGLGLATIYGIVTQNHGFIKVYSEPAIGTTFRIYFPRLEEDEGTVPLVPSGPVTGTGTILLVEDDPSVLEMTASMLENIGYDVHAVGGPLAALAVCENRGICIDVIISDVIMPTMSGKEMIEKIGKLRPGVKVLFMSGYTSDIIARRGVLEEGVNFIQKPFDLNTLNEKIREVMAAS